MIKMKEEVGREQYNLTKQEESVIRTLLSKRRFMSTREIATRSRVSWELTKKILINLNSCRKWVSRREVGNRNYWKIKVRKNGLSRL